MKKRIGDFKSSIARIEMGNLLGGSNTTCGATTPNTTEVTLHGSTDTSPDTFCDDDESEW